MARAAFSTPCHVDGGKLYVHSKRRMDEAVQGLKDGAYTLTLTKVHAKHSDAQRAYYFAVVVARLMPKFHLSREQTHEALKAQFLPVDAAERGENGTLINGLVIGGSFSKLNKLEVADFIDRIRDHAAAHWDTYIAEPDPNWREQAERERAEAPADPRDTMRREKGQAAA